MKKLLLLSTLLSISLVACGSDSAQDSNSKEGLEPIDIVVITDTHYLSPDLTDHGKYFTDMMDSADGKMTRYCQELIEAGFSQVIDKGADAVILTGDLSFNGAKESHIDFAKELKTLEDAGIPVFVLPGNHDLNKANAASFFGDSYELVDSVTDQEFMDIYGDYGYDEAIALDENSCSYVARLSDDLRLLMVDVNGGGAGSMVKKEVLEWVEDQLKDASKEGDYVIAGSHQTLFEHNPMFTFGYVMVNNQQLLDLYKEYGVICNLSGHMHIQHIAEDGLPEFVTAAQAVSPNYIANLHLEDHQGHYEVEPTDVSTWAKDNGIEDPNLLDFADYSSSYFKEVAKNKILSGDGDERNAEFFSEINRGYFSGDLRDLDLDQELLEYYKNNKDSDNKYMESIFYELGNSYLFYDFSF
ncbi:MAG: metallophosphoesterase [Pseudobutyrivibrio sp.]|nr:metallophosphoesterase [Pseudobutyrivibrio sp.]